MKPTSKTTIMKYVIAIFLIFYAIDCRSQIDKPIKKGNIQLGGSAGISYFNLNERYKVVNADGQYQDHTNEVKYFSFSLRPSFGYFIVDGLVIGISPSFSYTRSSNNASSGSVNRFGIEPFTKYYFNNGFFIGMKSGYYFTTQKEPENKSYELSFNPSIGYAFFINPKVSIEPSLEYSFSKNIINNSVINTISKENGIFFAIGFHIFL